MHKKWIYQQDSNKLENVHQTDDETRSCPTCGDRSGI